MTAKILYEDTTQIATYWWEDGALVVRLENKSNGAYHENVYDSRQAHKVAKKYQDLMQ